MKRIRQLDKLIDELARGKPLEKIKREAGETLEAVEHANN